MFWSDESFFAASEASKAVSDGLRHCLRRSPPLPNAFSVEFFLVQTPFMLLLVSRSLMINFIASTGLSISSRPHQNRFLSFSDVPHYLDPLWMNPNKFSRKGKGKKSLIIGEMKHFCASWNVSKSSRDKRQHKNAQFTYRDARDCARKRPIL